MSKPTASSDSGAADSLSYKDAGVDIEAGNALVERIKHVARRTHRKEVMGGLGGFGALCEIPAGFRNPVLVSGTDGVGTKLKLAMALNKHDTIGIDLVAMCVNDLIVQGAEPLLFLDYYATGALDVDIASDVIAGIGRGCELAGCALVGGETAEMPGMYDGEDYDLAGFCVGVVEKSDIIDGSRVQVGDILIGLPSSGPHSNGYSLIRKILQRSNADLQAEFAGSGKSLGATLLEPTRIYVKALLSLARTLPISAVSHITGGGLLENIPRVLPGDTQAQIDLSSWQRPAIFDWLQQQGKVNEHEMYRTFNCGVGLVIVVPAVQLDLALETLQQAGEHPWILGSIASRPAGQEQVALQNDGARD